MSITKKPSPVNYMLKITSCLILLLIVEFYIGGSFASEAPKMDQGITSIVQPSLSPMPLSNIQESEKEAQSLFFWHFAWLGSVLSICGLVGLSAVIRKFKPLAAKMFENHHITKVPNHIPTHW